MSVRTFCFLLLTSPALGVAQTSPGSDANPISTDRADKAGHTVGDHRPFAEVDLDRDGFLSRAELANDNEMIARFSRFDTDGDGGLSMEEYDAIVATSAPDPAE